MAHEVGHKEPTKVTTVEGELPEGSARVDLAPGFLKEGREGLAGILGFFLEQAALQGGLPPRLLQQLFGIGPGVSTGGTGGTRGSGGTTGGGTDDREGPVDSGIQDEDIILESPVPVGVPEIGDLPVLPTIPGLPGFLEGRGRGPNAAGAVVAGIGAGLQGLNSLKGLLGGGPKEPAQTIGGEGNITPIFPDLNQQQLQLFLSLLQQLSTGGPAAALSGAGGPAAALGPNPHTADVTGLVPEGIESTLAGPPPPIDFSTGFPIDIEARDVSGGGGGGGTGGGTGGNGDGGGDTGIGGETTPQDDALANFLEQITSGSGFQEFAKGLSLPTFEGPFTTPATALQQQALGASSEFLGTDLGERNEVSQQALQDFIESGGGRFDLSPQFSALETINKRRLDEQRAALNEQFGVLGARFGTDIARGQGELSSRFLESESAQRAAIAGQSFREQQARRLQGLGLGEEARRTDITARGQRGDEITEGFRLGEAERQIGDTAIQRQIAEFARTQGALLPLLLQFFGQGVGQEEIILPPE